MTSKNFKILIAINILIGCFLYADFILPSRNNHFEQFSRIESYAKIVKSRKFGNQTSYEDINLLYCKSYNVYKLFTISDCIRQIAENDSIVIKETTILCKIKGIEILNKASCRPRQVSFLEADYTLYCFCFAIIISLVSLFFFNKVLEILLLFATGCIYFFTVIYLFYIE